MAAGFRPLDERMDRFDEKVHFTIIYIYIYIYLLTIT